MSKEKAHDFSPKIIRVSRPIKSKSGQPAIKSGLGQPRTISGWHPSGSTQPQPFNNMLVKAENPDPKRISVETRLDPTRIRPPSRTGFGFIKVRRPDPIATPIYNSMSLMEPKSARIWLKQ